MSANRLIDGLKEMLREWERPSWKIERELPKILSAFCTIGILRMAHGELELTTRLGDDAAWEAVWDLLGEEGLTQLGDGAS